MTANTAGLPQRPSSTPTGEDFARAVLRAASEIVEAIPPALRQTIVQLGEMARDPGFQAALLEGLESARSSIDEEVRKYDRDPRSFLYDEMFAGPAVLLIGKVRSTDETILLEVLEEAISDRRLLQEAAMAIDRAPHLSPAQRRRIAAGLTYLEQKDWVLACDLLLKGVEGALWDTAHSLGVIDSNRKLASSPRSQVVSSPNRLVGDDGLPELPPCFARYLARQIFDRRGHDLRHARNGRDERPHALYAGTAFLGWLDQYGGTTLMAQLGQRLSKVADERLSEGH